MLLAIDVGNTNIVIGCVDEKDIRFSARFATDKDKTEDEYALMLMSLLQIHKVPPEDIHGSIISSVVPELKKVLQLAVKLVTGTTPLVATLALDTGLKVAVDAPATLGADLVVDAVAAIAKYPTPIIIFDMGTATTVSVIDAEGIYRGGMIIPGLRLSVDALSTRTSQLPRISLDEPEQLIGTNTINCMKAGAIYGTAAMLDGLVDRLEEELGQSPTVIATGGHIGDIVPYCRRKMIYDKDLMIHGLQILYEKNKGRQ